MFPRIRRLLAILALVYLDPLLEGSNIRGRVEIGFLLT
jgi:hypothetical protein